MVMSRKAFQRGIALSPATPTSPTNLAALTAAFESHSSVFRTMFQLSILLPISLSCAAAFPLYAITSAVYGRPPVVPPLHVVASYAWLSLTTPNIPLYTRVTVLLFVIANKMLLIPLTGLAWHLDEVLYGQALNVPLNNPVFVISGARSGSTTLGHLLDEDPGFCSPSGAMIALPYLWLWKLVAFLHRVDLCPSPLSVMAFIRRNTANEFLARHELNIFKPDTFEVPWLVKRHFFSVSFDLGADCMLANVPVSDYELDRELWDDFVIFTERILQKTRIINPGKERVMIKGHFLAVAEILEKKFEGATFVTVIRDYSNRVESLMNFMLANRLIVADTGLVPSKRNLLDTGEAIGRLEIDYIRREREFFKEGKKKAVVKFEEYVKDPANALEKVYEVIGRGTGGKGGGGVPAEIKAAMVEGKEGHANRGKMKYSIKLKLGEFGIDETKFRNACAQ